MPKPPEGETLTNKQKVFCLEYVQCFNATRAALKAGYSKRTAHYIGSENLAKPHIQVELSRLLETRGMIAAEVLARLTDQARASLASFMKIGDDGFPYFDFSTEEAQSHLHVIKKLNPRRWREINGKGEEWEHEIVEIELLDVQRAMELLMKAYGMFRDTNVHLHPVNISIIEYHLTSPSEPEKADKAIAP